MGSHCFYHISSIFRKECVFSWRLNMLRLCCVTCQAAISRSMGLQQQNTDNQNSSDDNMERCTAKMAKELNSKCHARNSTVQLLTPYSDPEHHSAQGVTEVPSKLLPSQLPLRPGEPAPIGANPWSPALFYCRYRDQEFLCFLVCVYCR